MTLGSIILTTAQQLGPALHKNFSETDFDFKVLRVQFRFFSSHFNKFEVVILLMQTVKAMRGHIKTKSSMRHFFLFQRVTTWRKVFSGHQQEMNLWRSPVNVSL